MAIYQKLDGVWTQCSRPYVNRGGTWVPVSSAWVNRSGVWTKAYEYDITPPNPPEITLQVIEDWATVSGVKTLKTRYIKVGARLPGSAHDPDAVKIRILTNYPSNTETAPTTQFGGTYTSAAANEYPLEPWSEWRYNQAYDPYTPVWQQHLDTSIYTYKTWPRNAGAGTILKSDWSYRFTGWALDVHGNWSAATEAGVHIAKAGVDMPNIIIKEARFQPNSSGSWRSDGYHTGVLEQQKSPRSVGLWFYGRQFIDSVGARSSDITIRSAQIYITRLNDNGAANANIYAYWNGYDSQASLPAAGQQVTKSEITKLGTLAKGQSKWFDLPSSWAGNWNTDIRCIGLDWKDPVKADAFPEDYSQIAATSTSIRCGEVHVVWEEQV